MAASWWAGTQITPRSPGYVNLGLSAISGFLRFCALHGAVPTEVADRLSEPRFLRQLPAGFDPGESDSRVVRRAMLRMKVSAKPPRFLSVDQQTTVVAATRNLRDRFLVELLFSTGLRMARLAACTVLICTFCQALNPWAVGSSVRICTCIAASTTSMVPRRSR